MRTLFLLPVAAGLLSAGEYSKSDRDTALMKLRESRQLIALVSSNLTAEQSNFKPESSVWSVTEVIEHLTMTEDFLLGFLKQAVEKGKPLPDDQPLPDPAQMDKTVYDSVSDRSQKAKAPEQAVPKGNYSHWEDALRAFSEKRGATQTWVEELKVDLRRFSVDSPAGKLDGHQWLLLMAAHTERHAKQIEELLKHQYFPKAN